MSERAWLSVPVGPDAERWVTRAGCRKALVVVHTVVAGQRLLDVIGLIESDLNVQVVFTQAPDTFSNGVTEFLRSLEVLEIPWQQAVHERFDLVVAAAYGGLDQLHGPIAVLSHGAGYGKRVPGTCQRRDVYGLDAQRIMRDGRVLPASILLSHGTQRNVLARQCPDALPVASVVGDPCYDRLLVSTAARDDYRAALGVAPASQLVVIASTWGCRSTLSRHIDLYPALLHQLDRRRFQVAALIHPAVWFGHGRRQVRAWMADAIAAGLVLIEPDVDWRAAVLAADCVVGDHGSTTVYAASVDVAVLHVGAAHADLDPASPQAWMARRAPRLMPDRPLAAQLMAAPDSAAARRSRAVSKLLTSQPGQAHRLIREQLYRLLQLPMPGKHRAPDPIPLPGTGGGTC